MITGRVNHKRQAFVELTIRGQENQEQTVNFLLDTGYNGAVMLPQPIVDALQLRQERLDTAILADGRRVPAPVYLAKVVWDGAERAASIIASGNQPLLGMSLALGHKITVEMVDGGAVTIERL